MRRRVGGSILVADAVRLLAGSGTEAELEDAGELELGDLVRPVRAWSVGWTAQRAVTVPFPASLVFEGGTAFAGREEELAGLRAAWAGAVPEPPRRLEQRRAQHRQNALATRSPRTSARTRAWCCTAAPTTACPRPPAVRPGAWRLHPLARSTSCASSWRARGRPGPAPSRLAARLPGRVAEPAPAEPEIQRLRTLEAAAACWRPPRARHVARARRSDWADDLSLLLLRHVLPPKPRLGCLVATYRDSEPSVSALLGEVVTVWRGARTSPASSWPAAQRNIAASSRTRGARPHRPATCAAPPATTFFVGEMVPRSTRKQQPVGASPRVRDRALAAPAAQGNGRGLAAAAVAGADSMPTCSPVVDVELDRRSTPWRPPNAARSSGPPGPSIASLRARSVRTRSSPSCRPHGACVFTREPPAPRARRATRPVADRRPGGALRRRRNPPRPHPDLRYAERPGTRRRQGWRSTSPASSMSMPCARTGRYPAPPRTSGSTLNSAPPRPCARGTNRPNRSCAPSPPPPERERWRAHGRGPLHAPAWTRPTSSRRTPRWSRCCAPRSRCWRRATARSGHPSRRSSRKGVLQPARPRAPCDGRSAP